MPHRRILRSSNSSQNPPLPPPSNGTHPLMRMRREIGGANSSSSLLPTNSTANHLGDGNGEGMATLFVGLIMLVGIFILLLMGTKGKGMVKSGGWGEDEKRTGTGQDGNEGQKEGEAKGNKKRETTV